jgi:hypothetical protein
LRLWITFDEILLAHVGAPIAWGPRIIDTADTAVATPLYNNNLLDIQDIFFFMLNFTILVSLTLKMTDFDKFVHNLHNVTEVSLHQIKLVFGLQCPSGELLAPSTLMNLLTLKDINDSFLNHLYNVLH